MLARKGLALKGLALSLGDSLTNFEDSMKDMGSTYRIEGISMNEEHFRVFGEEQKMQVQYADLIIGKRIGQGACSAVHLAEHERTGEIFAVKMFNAFDKAQRAQMAREVKVLTELDCEAILGIRGAWYHEGRIGIIIEYMDRGSLEFLENPRVKLDEQCIAGIVYQILWGLAFLHFDSRLHRDVKPANVLLNSQGQVKVSDFGISCALENTLNSGSSVGSFKYMSLERLRSEKYDSSSDIWSVGVMVIQLWTKIYPFYYAASGPIELLTELESIDLDAYLVDLNFPDSLRQFIMAMMARNPEERWTADDLINRHTWFPANGITDMASAQAVVRTWLIDQDTPATAVEAKAEGQGNGSFKLDRAGVRAHRSTLDHVLSDSHDSDHALLSLPPLSRGNSAKLSSSSNSIKTDLSNESGRHGASGGSRSSSITNLYARDRTCSSPELESSHERLIKLLPAQKSNFRVEKIRASNADDLLDTLGSMSLTSGGSTMSNSSRIAGKKHSLSLGSTEASNVTLNTTTRTQSTANYTTGTCNSDLNLSIVNEDEDYKDDFDEAENSLDEVADELVADYDDEAEDRLPARPRLRRPPDSDSKPYYRHK
jgi:serine/threonine protein kinase